MQVAEVISFRGNAVLRIREGDGAVEREVLSGRDPLQFLIHDRQFEIVHFGFSGPSRLGSRNPSLSSCARTRPSIPRTALICLTCSSRCSPA